jgi:hypothetical protein
MIGFDAIGQSAIGEIGGADDVVIFAPVVSITVAANVPTIIGTQIFPPVASVAVTDAEPLVAAGKSVAAPTAQATVTIFAPLISIGGAVQPTAVSVAVTAPTAEIQAGNVIVAQNTVTMITYYGEIGSSSIGEFAIGEGDESTRIAFAPPRLLVSTPTPLVSAGKSQFPPAANVNVTSSRAEIDSRRRKLRVFAIAS